MKKYYDFKDLIYNVYYSKEQDYKKIKRIKEPKGHMNLYEAAVYKSKNEEAEKRSKKC